jgi:hypothetical protein
VVETRAQTIKRLLILLLYQHQRIPTSVFAPREPRRDNPAGALQNRTISLQERPSAYGEFARDMMTMAVKAQKRDTLSMWSRFSCV